jgi:hypothetical protein
MLLDALGAPGWVALVVFLIGTLLAMRYGRAAVRRDVGGG